VNIAKVPQIVNPQSSHKNPMQMDEVHIDRFKMGNSGYWSQGTQVFPLLRLQPR